MALQGHYRAHHDRGAVQKLFAPSSRRRCLWLLTLLRLVINVLYRIVHLKWSLDLLPTSSIFHAQLMMLLSFALACYGTSCAYGTPELKRYDFTLERLDPRLEGMKIVMLSDIHISTPTDANVIYQLVNDVNALKPDLILLPGDLMDGSLSKRRPISNLLFDLKAKFGVFTTLSKAALSASITRS